jgi:hypothetical protein
MVGIYQRGHTIFNLRFLHCQREGILMGVWVQILAKGGRAREEHKIKPFLNTRNGFHKIGGRKTTSYNMGS